MVHFRPQAAYSGFGQGNFQGVIFFHIWALDLHLLFTHYFQLSAATSQQVLFPRIFLRWFVLSSSVHTYTN
jgi:hypothetical protein